MRGLLAPLSSNEEVTLRRVALGASPSHELSAEHLKRLEQLKLVEATNSGFQLTLLGRQRYDALPRPTGFATDGSPGKVEQMLAKAIRFGES